VIAVNANDLLDYFGRTVNMAARIQNQSVGDDLVLSQQGFEDLLRNSESETLLAQYSTDYFEASLQGIDGAFRLVRLKQN
jgi:class 3 adenylate cyclase